MAQYNDCHAITEELNLDHARGQAQLRACESRAVLVEAGRILRVSLPAY